MSSRTNTRSLPFLIAVGAALIVVMAVATPAWSASSGSCVSVRLNDPFRLPDGIIRPAGELTLCDSQSLSPVSELHAIRVNGVSVGIFESRRLRPEAGTLQAPQVVFEKDASGTLALVGYIVPSSGHNLSFRMKPVNDVSQYARSSSSSWSPSPLSTAISATRGR
jgi:hypothetical protein